MIPIKLEIQGLYSYKDTQIIDFEQLTAAGLFGLFGPVGSGKSSILEAILLALYGSTERLSDRGEKHSMINLQRDHLLINFEFRGGRNNTQRYLARYSAKRSRKNFDDVKPAEHTFYELVDGNPVPLEQRGEAILEMKKEHFKQTVIIPQGKFREFIDLTPGPRADMMKELFGLERFDLAPKTATLLKATREDKIRLDTQWNGFADVSAALLEDRRKMLNVLAADAEESRRLLNAATTTYLKHERMHASYKQLLAFRGEWLELEKRQPAMEEIKKTKREVEKAKTYLKPLWDHLAEERTELEKYRVSVINCSRFRENFEKDIELLEVEEKMLREKAQMRPDRETKTRDLTKVLEIQLLQKNLDLIQENLADLKPVLDTLQAAEEAFGIQIAQLEIEIDHTKVINSMELADWRSFVKDWSLWEKELQQSAEEMKQQQDTCDTIRRSLDRILTQVPASEENIEAWRQTQKMCIQDLEVKRDQTVQRQGLAAHVHMLHPGEACPLCGSAEHPRPLEPQSEKHALSELEVAIRHAKDQLDRIIRLSEEVNLTKIRLEHQDTLITNRQNEDARIVAELEALKHKISLHGLHHLDSLKQHVARMEQAIGDRERRLAELKALRLKLEQNKTALKHQSERLQLYHQQSIAISTAIGAKTEEIRDPTFCKPFYAKLPEDISETIDRVKRDIDETAFRLESKQKVLQETKNKQAANLASLTHYNSLQEKSEQKIDTLERNFVAAMEEHGFIERERLAVLFEHEVDLTALDREIRGYEDRCLLVKTKLDELLKEEGVADFDSEAFSQLGEAVVTQKAAFEQIQQEVTLLEQQISIDTRRLEEKALLEKAIETISQRETYLKELNTLFQGSGFVKYVSSIYLKELCNTANLRFRKLTKNSLSLEIDDSNTFWVVDYLNGGKRRLLKTLSGGQTFQASLCLALALAEKVKALNNADQSFFFLDEGFGALDRTSLRVVFETLKSLRQENRIVGIISHVEELQQEIEVYAQVELDSELGSQVSYSFK